MRTKKKTNFVKRNSGFIIGCVLAGGASFATSNVLMSDMMPGIQRGSNVEEQQSEDTVVGTIEPESPARSSFETDPFTVTANGSVVNGVESEPPQAETVKPETESETGEEELYIEGSSGYTGEGSEGGSDGSGQWYDDGSSDDWSEGGDYYDDGSGSSQPIEIYDPGNGDYYYEDSGESWDDGSGEDWSGDDGSGEDWSGDDGSGEDWNGDDGSGSDWNGDDGSGGDWNGDDGSGEDWNGDDGSGGDWNGDDGSGGSGSDNPAETPSDVILPGISSHYIDVSELYNYDLDQLRLIRNEIFALHGRMFNSQDLMDYFSQKSWYVPTYAPEEFDANMFDYLNDYEAANLQVIMDYEAQLGGY